MKLISPEELDWEAVSHNPAVQKQTFIRNGEILNLTVFAQAVFPPGEKAAEHAHPDMAEVFLVLSGRGLIRLNGETFDLTPGRCAVAEPGERHEIENTGEDYLLLLYFGLRATGLKKAE